MMTLDQCYQQYQGQSVLVDGIEADRGQCVQWADVVLNQVYELPYHYGNAIDWWNNPGELLNNFDKITDGSIKKGDFVIYGEGVGSVYGHIDVAAQDGNKSSYIGYDSNWGYNLTVHEVNHNDNYNQYILGSLRLKGGSMEKPLNADDIRNMMRWVGMNPDDPINVNYINVHQSDDWNAFIYDFQQQPAVVSALQAKYGAGDAQNKLDQIKQIVG